ncbi:MAG TPA: TPM domain-containing protein [Myxococcaceae bacterium]|nr:TPM domain-containing protein [Myxococcaceae bacterium]
MRALLSCTLLLCALSLPAQGETVDSIPRPHQGSWSVDTTGTLHTSTLAAVDQWGSAINDRGLGQLAVAVVNTTEGRNPRTFATELFNHWGIGHAGRDDGALLFIALQDRKAEIILGNGVDTASDLARSDSLMSGEIVPAFKRGDPNGAVRAGALGLVRLLENSPLNVPSTQVASNSGASAGSTPVHSQPEHSQPEYYKQPVDWMDWSPSWFLGGGAGGLVIGFAGLRRWLRNRPRICKQCQQPRQRLSENVDDAHLDEGQRHEEKLGSVDYDVWWCRECCDAHVERYNAWTSRYSTCPSCDYATKSESSTTLVAATYDHGGTVEVTVTCGHCSYRNTFTRSTPQRTRSESSSSSSFSGGSSSGSGSSGSW